MACIFCRIAKKEISAKIVYEDDDIVAFDDINPKAPVHVLIITKKHIPLVDRIQPGEKGLIGQIFLNAAKIAEEKGISDTGYRILVNKGKDAGQTIDHLHFHLLGGKKLPFA
jgi:histidine triad (HIT) family protein